MPPSRPVKVFISYAHEDEELRQKLEAQLAILRRQGLIQIWQDRQIGAGIEWAGSIHDNKTADLILLLISADFLASDYSFDVELRRAMELHEAKTTRVIPIILRPCLWQGALFAKLQALPTNGEPATSPLWGSIDVALSNIAEGIERTAKTLLAKISAMDNSQGNSINTLQGGMTQEIPVIDAKRQTKQTPNSVQIILNDGDWPDDTVFGSRRRRRKRR
jgi:TIR domain